MATNSKNTISEDFEGLTLGDIDGQGSYSHASAWDASETGASCSANVADDSGNQVLKLHDGNASDEAVAFLTLDSGYRPKVGYVEVDWKQSLNSRTSTLILYDSSGDPIVGIGFNYTGKIRYWAGSGWKDIQSYSAGTYYTIKIAFDLFNATADFYVNGTLKVSKTLSGSLNRVYKIEFSTRVTESNYDVYLDDFTFVGYPDIDDSDTISLSESTTSGPKEVSITGTDYLYLTDNPTESEAQTLEQDFRYYFGSFNGGVYMEDPIYHSDDGEAIPCDWYSKQMDFADQYQEALNKFKTIRKIRLWYVDKKANIFITVKISTDGGNTWTQASKSVGTGSGLIKSADFFFNETGHTFIFKVENNTDTDEFQWIGMEVYFEIRGDYFDV